MADDAHDHVDHADSHTEYSHAEHSHTEHSHTEHSHTEHSHDAPDPFDEKAQTWDDDPAHVERARMIAGRIAEEVSLNQSLRLLEFGAGTGLVSENLLGRVGHVTLADRSKGMREVMEAKVNSGSLEGATVIDLDLSSGLDNSAASSTDHHATQSVGPFDLIVTVLTLHHVDDPKSVLAAFHHLLEAGGHLCVVDLDAEDGSFHGDGFGGHHGFDRSELKADLSAAGFDEIRILDCGRITRDDGDFTMFLAIGHRSSDIG